MANNQGGNQGNRGGNQGGEGSRQQSQGGGSQGQQGGGRGFAGMDPDRQREIAAEGGRAAHASGNAHEFNSREAREAGSHSHDGQQQQQGGSRGQQGGGSEGGRGSQQSQQGGSQGQQGGSDGGREQQSQGGGSQGQQGGRGFAGMDPERQREIAAEGGRAAHASGNAHEFNSREAREAGSHSHDGGKSGGSR